MKPTTTFQIGDQATFNVYTDCHAGYIIGVSKSGRTVLFQRGNAQLLNGATDALQFSVGGFVGHTSGDQRYAITANPNGSVSKFTYRDLGDGKGKYKLVGSSTHSVGNTLGAGHHHYYDYNF